MNLSHHLSNQRRLLLTLALCEDPQPIHAIAVSVLEHVVDRHKEDLDLDKNWNVGVLLKHIEKNISFLPKFRNLHVY